MDDQLQIRVNKELKRKAETLSTYYSMQLKKPFTISDLVRDYIEADYKRLNNVLNKLKNNELDDNVVYEYILEMIGAK